MFPWIISFIAVIIGLGFVFLGYSYPILGVIIATVIIFLLLVAFVRATLALIFGY